MLIKIFSEIPNKLRLFVTELRINYILGGKPFDIGARQYIYNWSKSYSLIGKIAHGVLPIHDFDYSLQNYLIGNNGLNNGYDNTFNFSYMYTNPSFPKSLNESGENLLMIKKLSRDVRQIRMDFLIFELVCAPLRVFGYDWDFR